jgi:hypothetical protein
MAFYYGAIVFGYMYAEQTAIYVYLLTVQHSLKNYYALNNITVPTIFHAELQFYVT